MYQVNSLTLAFESSALEGSTDQTVQQSALPRKTYTPVTNKEDLIALKIIEILLQTAPLASVGTIHCSTAFSVYKDETWPLTAQVVYQVTIHQPVVLDVSLDMSSQTLPHANHLVSS